jgi:hypothetical protein
MQKSSCRLTILFKQCRSPRTPLELACRCIHRAERFSARPATILMILSWVASTVHSQGKPNIG